MKALIKEERGLEKLKVKEVKKPMIGQDEVLIEVKAAGVCGTDLHILKDEFDYNPPVILGHEVAGRISKVGSEVSDVELGSRVTTETYYYTCGSCVYCKSGNENLCEERLSIGSMKNGGFAEYLKVPAENIHILPENISMKEASLVEPLSCCVHGVLLKRKIMPSETVIIFGPGTIGLICLQLVKILGGNAIMVGTKNDKARLDIAEDLGADQIVLSEKLINSKNIQADTIIEASGAKNAVKQGLDILRKKGTFIQMGLIGETIEVEWDNLLMKEIYYWGPNATVRRSWNVAINLLKEDKLSLESLITHEFSLDEWKKAFENIQENRGIKGIFKP